MRKKILKETPPAPRESGGGLDVPAIATALCTSELEGHPVEYMFDGRLDTRWVADADGEQTLILAFDTAQTLSRVALLIEERTERRTQELDLALSTDGGLTFREVVRQEFNFSPDGTTIQRQDWQLPPGQPCTHLRLHIRPDKSGAGRATVTSLTLS